MEREHLVSIVQAVQHGDNNAATELYDAFYNDIYYYILKIVKDPDLAADLTQDTFIEILETIGKLQEPAAFVTWSRQIAYHRCTAHFRKRKDLIADENEDGYSVFDSMEEEREEFIPDEALDKEDLRQTIHAMIDALPEEQRAAIMMRYFDEISVKYIARIQDVTEGTVKSRLNYGRKAIKEAVEGYEKKYGIKLRCAGVIPLLLWYFRQCKVAEGISLTSPASVSTQMASSVIGATETSGVLTGTSTTVASIASETAATAVSAGVATSTGMSAAGTLALKIAIGVFSAVALVGGIAAAVHFGNGSSALSDDVEVSSENEDSGITHEWKLYEIIEPATCTSRGTATYICEKQHGFSDRVCNKTKTVKIKRLDHDYEDTVINSTFDEMGYTEHVCRDCGKSYKSNYTRILTPPKLRKGTTWYGYGEEGNTLTRRFDLVIDSVDKEHISGVLTTSLFYNVIDESAFEGTGMISGDEIIYEVVFDTPIWIGTTIQVQLDTIILTYNPIEEAFYVRGSYDVDLYRTPTDEPTIIAENVTWSGVGMDRSAHTLHQENHLFVMDVSKITDRTIEGRLTLSYEGNVKHDTEFVGRGYRSGNSIYYEVLLSTPRDISNWLEERYYHTCWLEYDCDNDTIEINDEPLGIWSTYDAVMTRQ